MDATEQLKQDVREGRIDADRLVELIVKLQRELQEARRRIDELEKKSGGSATTKVSEPFSLRAEELRQRARGKSTRERNRPLRHGRITTAENVNTSRRAAPDVPSGTDIAPSNEPRHPVPHVAVTNDSARAVSPWTSRTWTVASKTSAVPAKEML